MSEQNGVSESKIKKVLMSEAMMAASFVGIVVSVINYFGNPVSDLRDKYQSMDTNIQLIQQSISNINQNHEVHIQDLTQDIKDQNAEIIEIKKENEDQDKQIIILLQRIQK